jgi:hypothetical protein
MQNLKCYGGMVDFTSIYSKRQNFKYYNGIVNFTIIFRIFYLVKKAKFEILWWYSKFKNYLQNSKFKKAKFQLLLWFSKFQNYLQNILFSQKIRSWNLMVVSQIFRKFKKSNINVQWLLLWFSKFHNYIQSIIFKKAKFEML